jgi:hypothetical protein
MLFGGSLGDGLHQLSWTRCDRYGKLKEDDLLDWRFAAETLAELKQRVQEIERA